MSDDDFRWSDNEHVIIPEQPETAVYVNPFGQVVIRQKAGALEEDDPYVVVDGHNLERLCHHLLALRHEAAQAFAERFKLPEGVTIKDQVRRLARPQQSERTDG